MLFLTSFLYAQSNSEVTFRPFSAEDLIKICKNADDSSSKTGSMCLMYLGGFTDGHNLALLKFNKKQPDTFCPPIEVTPSQMASVIVKYGIDHPELLWLRAALFSATALKAAYPCQVESN